MSTEEQLVIAVTLPTCPGCHYQHDDPMVRVTSAKVVGDSWIITGGLDSIKTLVFCPRCGQRLKGVERAIPIECEGFTCPTCHSAEHLSHEVTKLDNETLRFTATISCNVCKRKRTLGKVFTKLFSILTIKVGPLGISAKKSEEGKDEGEE